MIDCGEAEVRENIKEDQRRVHASREEKITARRAMMVGGDGEAGETLFNRAGLGGASIEESAAPSKVWCVEQHLQCV